MRVRPPPPSVLLPKPRKSPWSGLGSLLLHTLLIGAIVLANWREVLSWSPVTEMGDPDKERGGGGGGGSIREVALPAFQRPAAPPAVAPPPPPPPLPVVPVPEPEPVVLPPPPPQPTSTVSATPDSVPSASTGQGGPGSGGGKGSGVGPGTGSGTGPGSGSGTGPGTGGEGGRGFPPEPRQLILPPLDYPKSMRGRTVAVTFWVATDGRVERVALDPQPEDGGFAKKLSEVMRNYRFRPARSPDGQVIPGTTTVSVTF